MMVNYAIGSLALVLLAAAPAAAQNRGECSLPPGAELLSQVAMPQGTMTEIAGPVTVRCSDGTTIKGDRAVHFSWSKEIQVTGNASFSDPEKTIAGDFLNYQGVAGLLTGNGNIVLTDNKSGTVIRGSSLRHTFAQGASLARTEINGPAHAVVRRADAAPGDTANVPTEIDADRFEIVGEQRFTAIGNVAIERGDVTGFAAMAIFDQTGERILLNQLAHLKNDDFRLDSDTIDARLVAGELSEVHARHSARLNAETMQVRSDLLRMYFEESKLQRLVARGLPPGSEMEAAGGADPRAVATAEGMRLVADSIEAIAPGQLLEEVIAVGNAYGERLDSLASGLPEFASRDWLRGDTIHGYFGADTTARAAAQDAERRRVIEKLVAVGTGEGAQSLHKIRDEGQAGPPSINFLIARRITVAFEKGEVEAVDAEGDLKGIHLQPRGAAGNQPQANGEGRGQ